MYLETIVLRVGILGAIVIVCENLYDTSILYHIAEDTLKKKIKERYRKIYLYTSGNVLFISNQQNIAVDYNSNVLTYVIYMQNSRLTFILQSVNT